MILPLTSEPVWAVTTMSSVVNLMAQPRVVCQPRTHRARVNLSISEFAQSKPGELYPHLANSGPCSARVLSGELAVCIHCIAHRIPIVRGTRCAHDDRFWWGRGTDCARSVSRSACAGCTGAPPPLVKHEERARLTGLAFSSLTPHGSLSDRELALCVEAIVAYWYRRSRGGRSALKDEGF